MSKWNQGVATTHELVSMSMLVTCRECPWGYNEATHPGAPEGAQALRSARKHTIATGHKTSVQYFRNTEYSINKESGWK